ncbi:MAG: hypothetical protein ACKVKF_04965, partial [Rhodobacterales bacterium]
KNLLYPADCAIPAPYGDEPAKTGTSLGMSPEAEISFKNIFFNVLHGILNVSHEDTESRIPSQFPSEIRKQLPNALSLGLRNGK